MSLISILILAVVIAILVKTGSIGKAIGFLLKYAFFPMLFGIIGLVAGIFLPIVSMGLGFVIGAVIGIIFVIKDANNKLQ